MNDNLILQIRQIENKIRRLELQRDFYKNLMEERNQLKINDQSDR